MTMQSLEFSVSNKLILLHILPIYIICIALYSALGIIQVCSNELHQSKLPCKYIDHLVNETIFTVQCASF